jgi:hypothetical protein
MKTIILSVLLVGTAMVGDVKFTAHRIGNFRSEAVGVADFNGDGKLDIVAGPFVYLAPDWKPSKIRTLEGKVDDKGKGYHDDFMNAPLDVDGDGKMDVVSCGWFCKCLRWYRNQLPSTNQWPETVSDKSANNEAGDLVDIDGDGKANEILAHVPQTVWFERGPTGLVKHVISTKGMAYGGGVGDVNGDGRPDVLRPNAWFEAPADPCKGQWIEHPWALGAKDGKADHTPQMIVFDVNADGKPDVITSSAHKHGIFWYEQTKGGWQQHTIDDTWSQAHSLVLADINGDGTPDLVTGKRFMAHNGSDPDEFGPLGVYWYELARGPEPKWTKHNISYNEGIGSGINLCVADLDADGDLDVIVTGKWGGPVWFENQRGGGMGLDAYRKPGDWRVSADGVLDNGAKGRTNDLITKDEFGDVEVHVEFRVPPKSNSGVYLMARYEVQVFDSFGAKEPKHSDCGGIYQRWVNGKGIEGRGPRVNASKPAGEWQSFDITFRAPRFDKDGKKTANACFVKVVHNGEVIHENVEVTGPTRASTYNDEKPLGPLMLQGDHGPIAYRNLRIRPL